MTLIAMPSINGRNNQMHPVVSEDYDTSLCSFTNKEPEETVFGFLCLARPNHQGTFNFLFHSSPINLCTIGSLKINIFPRWYMNLKSNLPDWGVLHISCVCQSYNNSVAAHIAINLISQQPFAIQKSCWMNSNVEHNKTLILVMI